MKKIHEKLKESKFIRCIHARLVTNYERTWDLYAMTKRGTMREILTGVEDEEIFDQRGKEFADELRKFINPNFVVLDIGCGIGRHEKILAPYCKEVHGIDVSKRMIKLASERVKGRNVFFYKTNGRDARKYRYISVAKIRYYTKEEVQTLLEAVRFNIVKLTINRDMFVVVEKS